MEKILKNLSKKQLRILQKIKIEEPHRNTILRLLSIIRKENECHIQKINCTDIEYVPLISKVLIGINQKCCYYKIIINNKIILTQHTLDVHDNQLLDKLVIIELLLIIERLEKIKIIDDKINKLNLLKNKINSVYESF